MAVTLAQARVDNVGTGPTISVSLGSAPTAGNLVVVVVGGGIAAGISMASPAANWTQIENRLSAGNALAIFARIVQPGESGTYTTNNSLGTCFIQAYELAGADSTVASAIPVANHNSQTNASGSSGATASVTPTASLPAYAIGGIWWSGGATSAQSVNGGFSAHVASNNRGASADLSIASTSGSYGPTFSWTTATASIAGIAVVQGPTPTTTSTSSSISTSSTSSSISTSSTSSSTSTSVSTSSTSTSISTSSTSTSVSTSTSISTSSTSQSTSQSTSASTSSTSTSVSYTTSTSSTSSSRSLSTSASTSQSTSVSSTSQSTSTSTTTTPPTTTSTSSTSVSTSSTSTSMSTSTTLIAHDIYPIPAFRRLRIHAAPFKNHAPRGVIRIKR